MDVMQAIRQRRSIRKYKNTPLEPGQIRELLEAARLAPSGHNTQPWRFIIVEDARQRETLAKVSRQQLWMATAPVYIVVCADMSARTDTVACFDEETPGMDAKRVIRDTSIAIDHMMLRAVELGLATCWVGWYDQKDVKPLLNIPEFVFVQGILVAGYADEAPKAPPRKNLEQLTYGGAWGRPYEGQ